MAQDMSLDSVASAHTDILHQVLDQSTEGFQVIDKNWKYVYVNKTVAKQGRSSVDDLTGHTMMERYPGIEKTALFTELKRCMEEGIAIRMENEFIYPSGEKGWFLLFVHPWKAGIMIFSVDITYKKQAEQRLSKMIEEYKNSFKSEEDKKKMDELLMAVENLGKPSVTIIG